jgi:LacI family transcriptional regulator
LSKVKAKAGRRKSRVPTIADVSAAAKVSPMTVSRVINGNGSVREATRQRVLRAVRKLAYTPNLAASSLAAARDARIALIYTNPSASYLSELLVGALRSAARTTAQLVIDAWDEYDVAAERAAARALARSVSGVILPPPICESAVVLSELARAAVPTVALGSGTFVAGISRVRVDDFRAAREITLYLIARGHRRIGFIRGDPNQSASLHRQEGFNAALQESGLKLDPELSQTGYFTYRSGLNAAERLLGLRRPPSAIFASNDDMAAAVVSVAHRRGLDVPRDLSVVGFDDTSAATRVWPELTTIRQPVAAMADAAINILVREIRLREGEPRVAMDQVLAYELVERDSVAPVRGGE